MPPLSGWIQFIKIYVCNCEDKYGAAGVAGIWPKTTEIVIDVGPSPASVTAETLYMKVFPEGAIP